MNIRVRREDGQEELLTLRGTFQVIHGRELDRLSGEDIEFFFTKNGLYDGWGCGTQLSPADADRLIDSMEDGRRIED